MQKINGGMVGMVSILSPERLSQSSNILLILILAYLLATLTWRVFGEEKIAVSSDDVTILLQNEGVRPDAAPSLAHIAALHLFGKPESAQGELAGEVLEAPETRLNLKLKGIFAIEQDDAVAIIAASGKDDRTYRVGDKIAGAAIVHTILPDRVILKRDERYETLTLPTERLAQQEAARNTAVRPSGGRAAQSRGLAGIRERLMKDPQQLFRMLKARPVMEDGQVKGYRLHPGRERVLFERSGLRPGDIVTGINGVALDNPENFELLLQQIGDSNLIDLTVERAGRPLTIPLELR